MSASLKELLAFVFRCSGIPFLIRNVYTRRRVSILIYHNPKPEVLDTHLSYLSKRFTFIKLGTLIEAIYAKNWSEIPTKSLVITLDDGYKDNYKLIGIFKKYSIIPTIYVCSQIVNTNRHFWFKIPGVNSSVFKYKYSNQERIEFLKHNFDFENTSEYSEESRHALNFHEIRSMQHFVDIQSHTCFHPILTSCSDEECLRELTQSKEDIEMMTGTKCEHFAYPNGNFTSREMDMAKKAGYMSARTTNFGWNTINTNPYQLKITGGHDEASVNYLVAQMSGIVFYAKHFLQFLSKML